MAVVNLRIGIRMDLPITLHADQEHDRLRTVIVLLLIFFFFIGYWLVNSLLSLDALAEIREYAVSISCVLGLVLALAVTAVIEAWLKRIWHSGRNLILNDQGILINDLSESQRQIRKDSHITRLNWYFKLKGYKRGGREKRISRKWICLACQIQQDDTRLSFYSYLPPEKASNWLKNEEFPHKFHQIDLADIHESSWTTRLGAPTRPQITNELLTGQDGRYWLAERNRWYDSFELTPQDFELILRELANYQTT